MKSEEELIKLAQDINAGKVFTDRHLRDKNKLGVVFFGLGTMDDEARKRFNEQNIGMVYQYIDKAQKKTLSGFPVFLSYETLSKEEVTKLFGIQEEIEKDEKLFHPRINPQAEKELIRLVNKCLDMIKVGMNILNLRCLPEGLSIRSYKNGVKFFWNEERKCLIDYNFYSGMFKSPFLKKKGINLT